MKFSSPLLCPIYTINTVDVTAPELTEDLSDSIDLLQGSMFDIVHSTSETTSAQSNKAEASVGECALTVFDNLATTKAPYRVSLQGIIMDITMPMPVNSGQMMRTFKLLDSRNKFVTIKQLGDGATDENLTNKTKVVLYYLSSKKGRREEDAVTMWAYENTYIEFQCSVKHEVRIGEELVLA